MALEACASSARRTVADGAYAGSAGRVEQIEGCARSQWRRALLAPDYARFIALCAVAHDPRPLITSLPFAAPDND